MAELTLKSNCSDPRFLPQRCAREEVILQACGSHWYRRSALFERGFSMSSTQKEIRPEAQWTSHHRWPVSGCLKSCPHTHDNSVRHQWRAEFKQLHGNHNSVPTRPAAIHVALLSPWHNRNATAQLPSARPPSTLGGEMRFKAKKGRSEWACPSTTTSSPSCNSCFLCVPVT